MPSLWTNVVHDSKPTYGIDLPMTIIRRGSRRIRCRVGKRSPHAPPISGIQLKVRRAIEARRNLRDSFRTRKSQQIMRRFGLRVFIAVRVSLRSCGSQSDSELSRCWWWIRCKCHASQPCPYLSPLDAPTMLHPQYWNPVP